MSYLTQGLYYQSQLPIFTDSIAAPAPCAISEESSCLGPPHVPKNALKSFPGWEFDIAFLVAMLLNGYLGFFIINSEEYKIRENYASLHSFCH